MKDKHWPYYWSSTSTILLPPGCNRTQRGGNGAAAGYRLAPALASPPGPVQSSLPYAITLLRMLWFRSAEEVLHHLDFSPNTFNIYGEKTKTKTPELQIFNNKETSSTTTTKINAQAGTFSIQVSKLLLFLQSEDVNKDLPHLNFGITADACFCQLLLDFFFSPFSKCILKSIADHQEYRRNGLFYKLYYNYG